MRVYKLSDVKIGATVILTYKAGSTPHSYNTGQFLFTPREIADDDDPPLPHCTKVTGVMDYGDSELIESSIYTAAHVADEDDYPADTLYRGSGCEPLFII